MSVLRVVGWLYLLSGGWCAFAPELAAGFLGFSFTGNTGYAEFFAVYGGLQVGLGAAIVMCSLSSRYIEAALYFSAILSSGLLTFRIVGMLLYGFNSELAGMALLETLIAMALWMRWRRSKKGLSFNTSPY